MKQEMLELTLLLVSLVIMSSYTFWIVYRYKDVISISNSFYKLPEKKRYLFVGTLWGSMLPLIYFAVSPFNWMLLTGIILIMLVPVFAYYRVKSIVVQHIVCASGGIVLAMVYLLTYHTEGKLYSIFEPVVGYAVIVLVFLILGGKQKTLWIEYFGYLAAVAGLLMLVYK